MKCLRDSQSAQYVVLMCLTLLAPLGLGLAVDRLFGTTPMGVLACAAIGIVAATIGIVRITARRMAALSQPVASDGSPDGSAKIKGDRAQ
jgi:F0F1-type ATP synthase assembly protein I